jgi:hypothetical protein
MKRQGMKTALANSLQAEDEAVKSRFEKAESLLGDRTQDTSESIEPEPSPPQSKKAESRKKVIRDSFTSPEEDYAKIAALQERSLEYAKNVTKSEIIRAGLYALEEMCDEDLLYVLDQIEKVKTGRPPAKR